MNTTQNREIIFTFDDTGSMHTVRARVRRNVRTMVDRLLSVDPNIRLGLVAHGDYVDDLRGGDYYLYKQCDLTDDPKNLAEFMNIGPTGGEGPFAAYEYVLFKARHFNWTAGKSRAVVMIGDEPPHDTSWHRMQKPIDWRNEARLLAEMGVKVFCVQALDKHYATPFYSELASITGGYHLKLDQFDSIGEILEAIAYKQLDDDTELLSFEQRLLAQGRMNRNLDNVFSKLVGRAASASAFAKTHGTSAGVNAVAPGRFQSLTVDSDTAIKAFVESFSIKFNAGQGFYELTKSEKIQPYKEIVLENKRTGDMITGRAARDIIGLPQAEEVSFTSTRKPWADEWRVFVQSTSYNRKLIAGTKFLYEVDKNA